MNWKRLSVHRITNLLNESFTPYTWSMKRHALFVWSFVSFSVLILDKPTKKKKK
jgi:hypothetical protein